MKRIKWFDPIQQKEVEIDVEVSKEELEARVTQLEAKTGYTMQAIALQKRLMIVPKVAEINQKFMEVKESLPYLQKEAIK